MKNYCYFCRRMATLDQIQETIKPELAQLNAIIAHTLHSNSALTDHIVKEYLRTKGKQIRPILVLLSGKLFGGVNDKVLYAGAAIELLHNASLIHDDVIDVSSERRGVPTINSVWDNHVAVLVGDYFVAGALKCAEQTHEYRVLNSLSNMGANYARLAKDPGRPMFNRTVQASYPPGSVFKLVNGLIGLQEGVLEPWYQYPCNRGYYYTKTRKLGCHGHRSPLRLEEAVMMSCNAYFCYVLKNLLENDRYESVSEAFDKWREYVLSFGFGQKLGSDFPSELGGNIPTSKLYDKRYGRRRWRTSNVISLSIGQGEIGATPLQIANLAAIMANRGYYYIPHIVKDSEGLEIDEKYKERHYTMVDTSHFSKVIPGMWMAVNGGPGAGGTAGMACVPGLDICGKTGTAQNPHGADNSVFICFAPRENPRIAVVGYIENAGWGGSWA